MAKLALTAMMALTLLPGIGRLSQHAAGAGAIAAENTPYPLLGAICTTGGLAYDSGVAAVEAIGFGLQNANGDHSPVPPHAGDDCDYCTIAASTTFAALPLLVAPTLTRNIASPSHRDRIAIWHYPLGLGSRGPPLTV